MASDGDSKIRLVIFDLDETVVHNTIPFSEMRRRIMHEIGCNENPPHLYEFLKEMGGEYLAILEREEIRRAQSATVDPAFPEIADFLHAHGCRVAILTRNSRKATLIALGEYASLADMIICRDDGFLPKPSPEAALHMLSHFEISAEKCIMVGDYLYDVQTGKAAGCITVKIGDGDADFTITTLRELLPLLEKIGKW